MKKPTSASMAPIKKPVKASGNGSQRKGQKPPKTGPAFAPRDAGGRT